MHGSRRDVPPAMVGDRYATHMAEWGRMIASFDRWEAGFDGRALFAGMPGGLCPVPHWGCVLRGKVRIRYPDREEVIGAGEAFYLEPGHIPVAEEDSEVVYFSPADEMAKAEALERK
jgi:hypothetical protein